MSGSLNDLREPFTVDSGKDCACAHEERPQEGRLFRFVNLHYQVLLKASLPAVILLTLRA